MTKNWIRVLLWLLTVATAVMIFGFSGQDGEESLGLSHRIVEPVVTYVEQQHPEMPESDLESLYWTLQQIVRKGGHLGEYALLGFLIRLLCESYCLKRKCLITWTSGTLYALTDELHQFFSAERSPALLDVGIDSIGVLIGMAVAVVLVCKIRRRNRINDDNP